MKIVSNQPYIGAHSEFGAFVIVFLLSVLTQIVSYDASVNLYDEGIILTGASEVLHGKLPYRDFWTMYGPGQFYVLSWLFELLGETNVALRIIGIVSKALIATITFVIIRRQSGGRGLGWIGSLSVLSMLVVFRQDGFPVFPALALLMMSILVAEHGLRRRGEYLFLAGCLTGLASCFRHDLGFYGVVAIACALCFYHFVSCRSLRALLVLLFIYVSGLVFVTAPVVWYFLSHVPLKDLSENLLIIPSSIYPANRRLPWPELSSFGLETFESFLVYVPIIAGGLIAFPYLMLVGMRRVQDQMALRLSTVWGFLLPATAVSCLLFTLKGAVRVEPLHMSQSLVLAVPLLIISWQRAAQLWGRWGSFVCRSIVVICVALIAVPVNSGATLIADDVKNLLFSKDILVSKCLDYKFSRAPCAVVDRDYASVAQFLKEQSLPGEYIYVGSERHDRIYANAVAIYFLVDHPPATKWAELHPGIQTQERIQREMIEEFERRRLRFIVLDGRWSSVREPNASSLSSGVRILDEYIKGKYINVHLSGSVRVLRRI